MVTHVEASTSQGATMKKKKAKQPTRKPKKEPARTLLDDFMFDRLDKFVPAVRRGTPKGEVIGFSLKKYSTILKCVYENIENCWRILSILKTVENSNL